MALSRRRRTVLAFYTGDPTCTLEDALIKSGYSGKRAKITAYELRRDPEFLSALERRQNTAISKLERGDLTDQEVVNAIRDIDEECKQAGAVAAFISLRLKANELLCKIRGMFVEKIEVGWGAEVAKEIELARERAKLPPLVIEGSTADKDLTEN